MRFAFEHFKIVTEPGAVVGLAAVLNGQIAIRNRTVATIITGGNIDRRAVRSAHWRRRMTLERRLMAEWLGTFSLSGDRHRLGHHGRTVGRRERRYCALGQYDSDGCNP